MENKCSHPVRGNIASWETTKSGFQLHKRLQRVGQFLASCLLLGSWAFAAQANVILSDNFNAPIDSAPSNWTTSSNWKIRQINSQILATEEDASAGSGKKLSRDFPNSLTQSWVADFDYDWRWGGNYSGAYGSYSLSFDMDLLDASNNGYRVRVHQGNGNNSANTGKTIEIFKVSAGSATVLLQGTGFNEPGWNTRSLPEPSLKRVRLSWEKNTGRLQAYRDLGSGLEVAATTNDASYTSFSKIVFTVNGFTASERPCLDNVVVSAPQERVWGVAGHPQDANYDNLGRSTQLDFIEELGANFYRVDTSFPSRVEDLRVLGAARTPQINILPIVNRASWSDTTTDQQIYQSNYNKAQAFTSGNVGKYGYIEFDNEVDNKCILPNKTGSQISHYDAEAARKMKLAIRGLADGARAGDPNIKRLLPSGGWYHYGFTDILLTGNPNATGDPWLVDKPVEFEVMNWHWYSGMGSFSRVANKLSSYGKPVWITEFNRSNGDWDSATGQGIMDEQQANTVEIVGTELANFPLIEGIFAYELCDSPWRVDGEAHYGLCDVALNTATNKYELVEKKLAFYAYQRVIAGAGSLPPVGDIIVDDAFLRATNADVSPGTELPGMFTSNWVSVSVPSGTGNQYFNTYRHDNNANKGTQTARFRPTIPESGAYVVSMWFPSSSLNSASVPVKIKSAGSSTPTTVTVNQQNGGKWVVLGTFNFTAGIPSDAAYVEISNAGTTGRVVADAVKFHKQ